jgi:hypothetical protein
VSDEEHGSQSIDLISSTEAKVLMSRKEKRRWREAHVSSTPRMQSLARHPKGSRKRKMVTGRAMGGDDETVPERCSLAATSRGELRLGWKQWFPFHDQMARFRGVSSKQTLNSSQVASRACVVFV